MTGRATRRDRGAAALAGLTRTEWERLCDGCGRCCVHRIEDPAAGLVYTTNVACRLLDLETCRCRHYRGRRRRVPECLDLYTLREQLPAWLPSSCAYRRLAEGHALPSWHPQVTGDPASTQRAGMSIRDRLVAEADAGPLANHIVSWEPLRDRG